MPESPHPARALAGLAIALLIAGALPAAASAPSADIPDALRQELMEPLREVLNEYSKSRNAEGIPDKRTSYSRNFRKVDDTTYEVTMHVDTAGETVLSTERLLLTLKRDPNKKSRWVLADKQVEDTLELLRRGKGGSCYPFDTFEFNSDGMHMKATNGYVCEQYFETTVNRIGIGANDLSFDYNPPEYVDGDYIPLNKVLRDTRHAELVFKPQAFTFTCDSQTCEEILDQSFTGLTRKPADQRSTVKPEIPGNIPAGLKWYINEFVTQQEQDRRENAFAHFTYPDPPGHRWWNAVAVENDNHRVGLSYDNWDGYELQFWVYQDTTDLSAINGTLYGYYTKDTYDTTTPFEREQRDDIQARWHEVDKVSGAVDVALFDPEMLDASLTFGINLKQDLDVLPFFIASIPGSGGNFDSRALFVNSVEMNGEELTYVKTGPISGLVVLPEPGKRGDHLEISMSFATKAIKKTNHAASQMNRFGWMPFVRFGDFIDEFEMTIRTPAEYDVLGVGHEIARSEKDGVLTTEWRAESPVVFPTIIFGKYVSDGTGKDYQATKLSGEEIPVEVYVDVVSMGQLDSTITRGNVREFAQAANSGARGIRAKQLRPIATQAAVSINLYKEISGVDYPYGELNLVNDPVPALYGQAPSSLIYLGSNVFRGEGTMAGTRGAGGGTGTAKFLKSVVAHEVGHQWWGSRVSNANQRNYWFVETLAEYFSAIYLERVFGRKEYDEQVEEWRRNVIDRDVMASVQNASTHWSGEFGFPGYQALVYNKGPYMFHILRETFGDEKFFEYLKKFTIELTEKREIVSRDIQVASEKNLGGIDPNGNPYNVDLEWFFDQWLRGTGVPEYRLQYDVRQAENGQWIVEGVIHQRVIVGSSRSHEVMEGRAYRGVMDLTALVSGGKEYRQRVVVDGAETPFRVAVPDKPLEITLNKNGGMLAHDVKVNVPW